MFSEKEIEQAAPYYSLEIYSRFGALYNGLLA